MDLSADQLFAEFADRFVRSYWEDVIARDDEDFFKGSIEDHLAGIEFRVSQENCLKGSCLHKLRMEDDAGDWWEFTFKMNRQKWMLIAAKSGPPEAPEFSEIVDWMDEFWGPKFRPLLDRVMQKSGGI